MIQRWSRVIGFVIAAVFLILALYNVDLAKVANALSKANYIFVLPALLCTITGYILRTTRWKVVLQPTRDIPVRRLFPILVIGFAVNNLIPARVGELVRAWLIGEREHISKSAALATIIVERIFDGLALVLILLIVAASQPLPEQAQSVLKVAEVTFGIGAVILAFFMVSEKLALRAMDAVVGLLPARFPLVLSLQGLARMFVEGLHALRSPKSLVLISLLSLSIWMAEGASYFMLTFAFDVPFHGIDRVWASLFVLTMINLGNLVPGAPGFIGGFELFGKLALMVFGADESRALALTIVAHAMQYSLITGLGIWLMSRYGLSLGMAQQATREPAPSVSASHEGNE